VNEILIYGRHLAGPFLVVLDLLGTFVFALSGAAAGVKSKLDLFGLMVLAFATGNAGGITRDLLIGAVPPAAIRDWRYLGVCLLAGLVIFFLVSQYRCSAQASAVVRWRRPGSVRRYRNTKSAGRRTQSSDGCTYGNVDRDWRRNSA
jgi:Glycine transporter